MDVEDPLNPAADDAALDVLNRFGAARVRGSFCVTGEKWRTLEARGRTDVIDSLRRHCLGLHTDTHSRHPTVMEMLADCSYEDGKELALREVARAADSIHGASFWGGAGNTWSPEINWALREVARTGRLVGAAYAYALTEVPHRAVHRFNGAVGMPQHVSVAERVWARSGNPKPRIERALSRIRAVESPWVGVFVGHPTRLRHRRFWDAPFARGRAPKNPRAAPLLSDEVYGRSLDNLECFLRELPSRFAVLGVDEALALPWRFRPASLGEQAHFVKAAEANLRSVIGWPIHRPNLDASTIVAKTLALTQTLEVAQLA